jgi:conjugative relaxase-like TrwC/TraI family protein
MGFLIDSVTSPQKIEYPRAILEPKKYHPEETIDISNFSAGGTLWAELGLSIPPTMEILRQLARGKNPVTRGRLTARKHATSEQQHPTSFFSGVFNVPKSISEVSELGGDERLRREVLTAGKLLMQLIEREFAGFRVRKKGARKPNEHHVTGSMGYVIYLENDSRYGDPNIHLHVLIINATKDVSDPRKPFKALSPIAIFRAQKIISTLFHELLEQGVRSLGYDTVTSPENKAFEIAGIPRSLIDKFSKGHVAIKRAAAAQARKVIGTSAAKKSRAEMESEVALKVRPKKKKQTQVQLHARWRLEVTLEEELLLQDVIHRAQVRSLSRAKPNSIPESPIESESRTATVSGGNYFPAAESVMPVEAPVDWNSTLEVPPLSYFLLAAAPVEPPHVGLAESPLIVHPAKVSLLRVVRQIEPEELPEI